MRVRKSIKKFISNKIQRVRTYRHHRHIAWLYQNERNQYYKYATKKILKDQNKKVSIVVPVYNTPDRYILPLIDSVYNQGYENWELIFADGSSDDVRAEAIKGYAGRDGRIIYKKIKNKGIAGNTNEAIKLATGDYIAFMDHDDMLDPDALAESAEVLNEYSEFGLVYSDEDKISDDGEQYLDPHFKPGFSLDMLRNVNYITHFVVVRKEIVDKIGGIREGFDGAQDYDFLLRVIDGGAGVAHIPKILYHWRIAESSTAADFSNKKDVLDAGCRALDDHYRRNKISNVKTIAIKNRPGFYKPEYKLSKNIDRVIYVNLDKFHLNPKEKGWILSQYQLLDDVRRLNIRVVDNEKEIANADQVMIVSESCVPIDRNQDIAGLFGIVEDSGVYGVSPRITQHNKIMSIGDLNIFHNSIKNDFFGSNEWVRNSNKVSSDVYIKNKKSNDDGRRVIWSHCEFSMLNIGSDKKLDKKDLRSFSNKNVTYSSEIVIKHTDYLGDKLEGSL